MRAAASICCSGAVLALFLLGSASGFGAPVDAMRVGSAHVSSPGSVSIPIYFRDGPGSDFGHEGEPIRGLSIVVTESHPEALVMSLTPAGVLDTSPPIYKRSVTRSDGAALFLWLPQASPFVVHQGYGDRIATLNVTVPAGLPEGLTIELGFSPDGTYLSGADWRVLLGGRVMPLDPGSLHIGTFFGDATGDRRVDVFDLVTLANYVAGNVALGQAPFLNPWESVNLDPATSWTVDIFDLVLLAGHLVGNVPQLPVP